LTLLQSLQAGKAVGVERLVAWQLAAVLHFIPDTDDPYGIVDIVKSVMADPRDVPQQE